MHAVAERAGAGDAVEACSRPPCRGVRWRAGGTVEHRDAGDDLRGDRFGAVGGKTRAPAPAEDDPDVHPSAGNRGDADVAVVEHAHPGIGAGIAGTVLEVVGEADARGKPGGSGHARGPGDDRGAAVGPDDEPGRVPLQAIGRAHVEHRPRPVEVHRLDPGARAHRRTGRARLVEERRIERRAVEPDRLPVAVRQAERDPCGCLHAHRRDRPGNPGKRRLIQADPAERGDRGGRGEHAAGSPAVRRASLEHGDVVAGAGQQRRDDCPGRPAADDRDVRSRHGAPSAGTAAAGTATTA